MKLVIIGGTGLIGSKLVARLREQGHDAVPAAPNTGVNTITGEGLADVLRGAAVVIDVSNSPSLEAAAVMEFFTSSTRNLLSHEAAAGVVHHVALSVVGTERQLFRRATGRELSRSRRQPAARYRSLHRVARLVRFGAQVERFAEPPGFRREIRRDELDS